MTDTRFASSRRLLNTFTALALLAGSLFAFSANASDVHDLVRQLRENDQIIGLSELIRHAGLQDVRILEAELESEYGRLVYELEFLDQHGRVYEQYFDATNGQPLSPPRRD